jgi:ubiquinone/menaquinone biosynthesis C-methylase UbiE
MNPAFDSVATKYDSTFTQSIIGQAQREIVRDYLESVLNEKEKQKILELNCGTGEDAIWFANKGHTVLATDISEKMLEVTEQKIKGNNLSHRIRTKRIDLSKTEDMILNDEFDLIFSNFGGINCIQFNDLYKLPESLFRLLKPGGRIILVIMPTFCVWEMFYFTIKLNLKKAFRRSSTKGTKVYINGEDLTTYYYTPITISKIFQREFEQVFLKPLGFFIPPSYLEKFFSPKQKTFKLLKKMESSVTDWSVLANYSDHFLIDFVSKQ